MKYTELLEKEKIKLLTLYKKINECKEKIAIFNKLSIIENKYEGDQILRKNKNKPIRNRMNKDCMISLLKSLGSDGANLDELEKCAAKIGAQTTRGNLATLMNNFKKKDYIINPYNGFYQLTQLGLDFISSQEKDQ